MSVPPGGKAHTFDALTANRESKSVKEAIAKDFIVLSKRQKQKQTKVKTKKTIQKKEYDPSTRPQTGKT